MSVDPHRRPPPPPNAGTGFGRETHGLAPAAPAAAGPDAAATGQTGVPAAAVPVNPYDHVPESPPLADPSSYGFGPWQQSTDDAPQYALAGAAAGPRPRWHLLLAGGLGALLVGALVLGVLALTDNSSTQTTVFDFPDSGPSTQLGGEVLDIQGVLTKVQPSVVTISAGNQTRQGLFEGAGSGVVISEDGMVLTNAHVIAGADTIEVTFFDGTTKEARLVGSFPEEDIAVIQAADIVGLLPAELGTAENLKVGDDVVAIGNALNLGSTPSVTKGIVSAKDRVIEADPIRLESLIQTDAAINPGNSGGPLVDARGRVVGINTAIIDDAQNIGFAISIDVVKPLIERVEAGDADITPDTAFLGVTSITVASLDQSVRDQFGVAAANGAFVQQTVVGSPAEAAGIERGDVVTELDGQAVASAEDVARYVRNQRPGQSIEVTFERNGQQQTTTIELGVRN